ncbi:excisionase family DNA-binding protein [Gulosibacter sediminis]|uniref:excisionase family DNA-binding protein n=1 Tax=Gulosibacter sediminis TaxID=1729695 RepID=UPI0024A91C39|nr:excisionase family DNA-binding protein [Gulosibacter sediminis]
MTAATDQADISQLTTPAITRTQAASYLGVDPRTISAGIKAGTIPAVRLGSKVLIPREKFLALFAPSSSAA